MRPSWIGPPLVVLLAACGPQSAPPPVSSSSSPELPTVAVTPANIRRVARELPPGYEVTQVPRAPSPRAIWGLGADTAADPAACTTLSDPAGGREKSAQGVSGSGSGGIVDAVVVALPRPAQLDHHVVTGCAHWDLTAGRTVASIALIDAPHIDGAQTVGMVADIRSAVESGSEIVSRAYTFGAYLGDFYVFTTLTNDPGSMLPALPAQYAADLLVKTVSTLRS